MKRGKFNFGKVTRKIKETKILINSADMGIRTPVAGVRGRHDWPLHYISRQKCVIRLTAGIFIGDEVR